MAAYVTVEAIRATVINHYILYPGERRQVARGDAERLLRERPGCIFIVLPVKPEPAPVPIPEPPPVDAEPRDIEMPPPGPVHGDQPPVDKDDRPRLSDVDRPRPPRQVAPPRKPKAGA